MNKKEIKEEFQKLMPAEIQGYKRPEEGLDTGHEFNIEVPKLIAKDPVRFDTMNLILSVLLSNDKNMKEITDVIKKQLASADLRIATENLKGLMSPEDKKKLDSIAQGATNYVHPKSGVRQGTYSKVEVNAEGHVIKGSNPTTLAGYGITDALQKGSGNFVPTLETANNARFLRNDNTWQNVTPSNIGAATATKVRNMYRTLLYIGDTVNNQERDLIAASNYLRDLDTKVNNKADRNIIYTKGEVDSKVNAKADRGSVYVKNEVNSLINQVKNLCNQKPDRNQVESLIKSLGGGGIIAGNFDNPNAWWFKFDNKIRVSWKEPDKTVPIIVQGGRGYGDITLPISFQITQIGGFVCDRNETGEVGMHIDSNTKIRIYTQNDSQNYDAYWLAIGF